MLQVQLSKRALFYIVWMKRQILFCSLLTSQKKEGLVYETVMQTFDEFFELGRNVIFEREQGSPFPS